MLTNLHKAPFPWIGARNQPNTESKTHMNLEELSQAAASMGGQWRNLRHRDDGTLEGRVLAFEQRDKTFDGEIVLNRKTKQPRQEWVFTLAVDGETDPIKISLNESGQRAVSEALREAKTTPKVGDVLKIAVSEDPEDDRSQATYRARWTPSSEPINLPAYEEPF